MNLRTRPLTITSILITSLLFFTTACNKDAEDYENAAPKAHFWIEPTTGDTSIYYVVKADSISDREDEDHQLKIRWDWNHDGEWDTDYTTNRIDSIKFSTGGQPHWILMEVMDTEGLTSITHAGAKVDVEGNHAPNTPHHPIPTHATTQTDTDLELSWECEDPDGHPISYDLYIDTTYYNNDTLKQLHQGAIQNNRFQLENLVSEKTYYWRVVARDIHDLRSKSPVWKFKTR